MNSDRASAAGGQRVCRRCLLSDLAGEDRKNIDRYLQAVKEGDRAPQEEYERRLGICRTCERLQEGTCLSCGCYVEFRAIRRRGTCPKGYWKETESPDAAAGRAGAGHQRLREND